MLETDTVGTLFGLEIEVWGGGSGPWSIPTPTQPSLSQSIRKEDTRMMTRIRIQATQ